MTAKTSKDFGLQFFYFAFACLLYSIWRAVDLLMQVELIREYEHSPIMTADNTLTLTTPHDASTRRSLNVPFRLVFPLPLIALRQKYGEIVRARTWFGQFRGLVIKFAIRNAELALDTSAGGI